MDSFRRSSSRLDIRVGWLLRNVNPVIPIELIYYYSRINSSEWWRNMTNPFYRALVVLTAAISLSGCSMKFIKPGAGNTELKRDWTNCQAKMGQAGVAYQGLVFQREFMQSCMEGEGWERTN